MLNLEVKIQKTELAKSLEETLNIKWELNQQFPYDAGFDLRACIDRALILLPTGHTTIPTGIHVEFSEPNWEMQVRPRSGLAAEHGITVLNTPGTVDFGYRKEIQVILYNCDVYDEFQINPGDRIAQACFREIPQVSFQYVDAVSETIAIEDDTVKAVSLADEMKRKLSLKRGGLGSTGKQ
jgi:dUTP pyrophosphatase|tara:strand:+ start:606 stop:1148 length:543 start_codon:yes stop_codon:yes gene_type:complete